MADNLTVSIGADTSKLRADIRVATEELRKLKQEANAAAREAARTGDRSAVYQYQRQVDAATASLAALRRQAAATNDTIASPAWAAATRGVGALTAELGNLSRGFMGAAGAVGGMIKAFDLLGKTVDQVLELMRQSKATGFDPTAIKALNEVMEETGSEAGAGNRALINLSQAFAQVRQEARNAGEQIGSGVTIYRGGSEAASEYAKNLEKARLAGMGITIYAGAQKDVVKITNAAEALAVLNVDLRKFKDDQPGNTAAIQAVINGFASLEKRGQVDLGNLAARVLFGAKSMKELGAAFNQVSKEAGGLAGRMNELREQQRDPNDDAIKAALEYKKAIKDVGDAVDSLGFALLRTFGPEIQTQAQLLTNDINAVRQAGQDMAVLWETYIGPTMQNAWAAFIKDLNELWNAQNWSDLFASMTTAWNNAVDWMLKKWQQIKEATASVSGGAPAGDPSIPAMPMAAGGYIRGRGTGTSDSILARLSNGEFVVNAAATSRFLPLLRALNDGMRAPLMPRTSFATGGLVMADVGGASVHLHLDNHIFSLRADQNVAESLMRTARAKQMLSAGRKPSWAGGRRYGG